MSGITSFRNFEKKKKKERWSTLLVLILTTKKEASCLSTISLDSAFCCGCHIHPPSVCCSRSLFASRGLSITASGLETVSRIKTKIMFMVRKSKPVRGALEVLPVCCQPHSGPACWKPVCSKYSKRIFVWLVSLWSVIAVILSFPRSLICHLSETPRPPLA